MTSPTLVKLPDGSEMTGSDMICEGCGSSVADHPCGGRAPGGSVTFTSGSRSLGPRKKPTEHPECAHCGGRVHFNMSGTAINAECINRQYALDTKEITDPNQRPGVMTLERMKAIVEWSERLSDPLTYGNMVTAAGGAGTYSGLKPKTGRKKKAVAAAPGSQIQDMADDEAAAVATDGEAEAKPKKSRSRKPKVSKLSVDENGTASVESVDLEAEFERAAAEIDAARENHSEDVAFDQAETTAKNAEMSEQEKRAARRAARAEERKKMLAAL